MSARFSLRRLMALASVGIVAAMMLGAASSAQAADEDVACVFTGSMGPLVPGVFSWQKDLADGGPVLDTDDTVTDGEADGHYFFSTAPDPLQCVYTIDRAGVSQDEAGVAIGGGIVSDGDYDNNFCSTGKAESGLVGFEDAGSPVDSTPITFGAQTGTGAVTDLTDIASFTFNLPFTAAQGVLDIDAVNGIPQPDPVEGFVTIQPAGTFPDSVTEGNTTPPLNEPCVLGDHVVDEFGVQGAFAVRTDESA